MFPVTNNLADPKPQLVTAPIVQGQPRALPLNAVNATALLYLHTLGKLVLVTQVLCLSPSRSSEKRLTLLKDDVFTVDPTTGALAPNNIPFPGAGFFNSYSLPLPSLSTHGHVCRH